MARRQTQNQHQHSCSKRTAVCGWNRQEKNNVNIISERKQSTSICERNRDRECSVSLSPTEGKTMPVGSKKKTDFSMSGDYFSNLCLPERKSCIAKLIIVSVSQCPFSLPHFSLRNYPTERPDVKYLHLFD